MIAFKIEALTADGWSDDPSLLGFGASQDENRWPSQAAALAACAELCAVCSEPIPDPAERWPAFTTGTLCQQCWEAQSSRLLWAMVPLLPEEGVHAH